MSNLNKQTLLLGLLFIGSCFLLALLVGDLAVHMRTKEEPYKSSYTSGLMVCSDNVRIWYGRADGTCNLADADK